MIFRTIKRAFHNISRIDFYKFCKKKLYLQIKEQLNNTNLSFIEI